MNGLDQVAVSMWFLPVVLFIIIPFCVGLVWLPIALFVKRVQREAGQERQVQQVISEARAAA